MNPINVALICPFSTGPARGNMTTVRRIAEHLPHTGCRVTLLSLETTRPTELRKSLNMIRPDLLHAFHAFHAGPATLSLARELGIPYLITITGSDLFDPELRAHSSTGQALADASAIACFDPLVAGLLAETFPGVAEKISVVPQGIAALPAGEPFHRLEDDFRILLSAAIRPVKGITKAMEALAPLVNDYPSLSLLLAGGDLDPSYSALVKEMASRLSWVDMLGEVPRHRMGEIISSSDLILNCSFFEGGMSNSILEGMIMGKPVLARNVLGNRSLIRHGVNGWLYNSDHELREFLRAIFDNPELGVKTGATGRKYVQERFSVMSEARSYRRLYEQVIGGFSKINVWKIQHS